MQYRNRAIAAFLFLAITGLALLSLYLLAPPKPVPATAPATVFSAERAMQHVRQVAQEPHPMGTKAHANVRDYLLQQMQELGLNPQVQDTTAAEVYGGAGMVGHVYNLVGRLLGNGNSSKAILLMAHYDSQPNALGAGDDGAGVAAILETVRALKQEAPLDHDVIVLLTDGEEFGLYGARAFLKHPWAQEVGLVMNLEGRGNDGPSMTFEMSPENGWVARQYAEAAPHPFFSSLAYEIYSRMPNDTDFTVYREAGFSGLNSAFIGGFVHYHKATDAPENLSQRSLQHHGTNLLELTRHFGHTSLEATKAPDAVFFNLLGDWVITYSAGLNIVWVVITALLLVITLVVAFRKQAITAKQLIFGFLLYLLLLIVVVALFYPINELVWRLLPLSHRGNGVYSAGNFFVAYVLLALGLFLLLTRLVLRWLGLFSLVLGVCILQFILMMTVYLLAPNAAYLFIFPLLFSLCGVLVVIWLGLDRKPKVGLPFALVLLLASIPAIFLMMPIIQVVFTAFALQLPYSMVALLLLLAGLLLPLLVVVERSLCWKNLPLLPVVLVLAGAIQVVRAVAGEMPTAERPLHSHVSYYLNADTNKAYWASAYTTTDDWNSQFFPEPTQAPLSGFYPYSGRTYLQSSAEAVALPAPVAEVVQDSTANGERLLRLRLKAQRPDAIHLETLLELPNPDELLGATLAGEPLELKPLPTADSAQVYLMRLHGLPPSKEVELLLRLKQNAPLTLHLSDQSMHLPAQLVKRPKPPHVIAEQGRDSNLTVVRKSYRF
ncbi:M20/M25/M40 family metallo-hydrolase [Pontibacter akesuensis]|uniref:Vacuolar membrane protease n=1 Tax=Pontibacter akesuensis TaxID=388950 RepID=A0A1I7IG18_9BACT|nr:M20/M25/M40 family metallo-hydrolase [Pontibacter akesuensis]GHA66984.1 aminopeptidase [Pontibacter akesuensis]SFU71790.1 Peptidase family M28 [Pontibacter akesuensis]